MNRRTKHAFFFGGTVHLTLRPLREFCCAALLLLGAVSSVGSDFDPQLIGMWPEFHMDTGTGIAAAGHYVYLVGRDQGLQVIDFSDPSSPRLVGKCKLNNHPGNVVVVGSTVFVAGFGGVRIVDASNPASPEVVGEHGKSGPDLSVAAGYMYLSLNELQVFDVSKPSAPAKVGAYPTGPGRLAAANGKVYLLNPELGLAVFGISAPDHPELLGNCPVSGLYVGLAIEGNRAYVQTQEAGIQVLDVSDPAQPRIIGSQTNPNGTWLLGVRDEYAYSYDRQSHTVKITDVSRPEEMHQVGQIPTDGESVGIAFIGDLAITADNHYGLQATDISDVANPRPVTYSQQAHSVELADGHAYLANGKHGLAVIDVSDPTRLTCIARAETGGAAFDVAVTNGYALVASDTAGLQIFDVSRPAQPKLVGNYGTEGGARCIKLAHARGYLAESNRLHVLDVSRPADPKPVSVYPTLGKTITMLVSGNYAFVAGLNGGEIIDVSAPGTLKKVATFSSNFTVMQLAVSGSFLLRTASQDGLAGWDISNPARPRAVIPYIHSLLRSGGMAVSGDYLHIAAWRNWVPARVHIMDISALPKLTRVGSCEVRGYPYHIAALGRYTYIAGYGLQIVDSRIPANPQTIARGPSSFGQDVAVHRNHAYAAEQASPLRIFDVSMPSSLKLVGAVITNVSAIGTDPERDLLCLALGEGGIMTLSVTNPAAPSMLGWCDTPGRAERVALTRTHGYVADYASGVQVVDVSNPASPHITGSYTNGASITGVTVVGNLAYVTSDKIALDILDVSIPTEPRRIGCFLNGTGTEAVAVNGSFAYVAAGEMGLLALDVSIPTDPRFVAAHDTPGYAEAIALQDGVAYLADTESVQVFDVAVPAKPHRLGGNSGPSAVAIVPYDDYLLIGSSSHGLVAARMLPVFKGINRNDQGVELTWRSFGPARLQSAPLTLQPVWRDVPGLHDTNSATVPINSGGELFRLVRPEGN